MKRFLAITPYGGRSGSEMVLWQSLKKLPLDTFQPELYILSESELAKEDKLPFPIHINPLQKNKWLNYADKVTRNFASTDLLEQDIMRVHNKLKPDFWYLNTTALYQTAQLAIKNNIPFIVHVHETMWLNDFIPTSLFKPMMEKAKLLIACSEKVKNIVSVFNPNTTLLYSCFDASFVTNAITKDFRTELRNRSGVPDGAWLWAVVGRAEYNKGVDHLPTLFEHLSNPDKHYILWIGKVPDKGIHYYVSATMASKKRSHQVIFAGQQTTDYYNYLSSCDGLLVLSREDSFPVSMLEAGHLKKPILGFRSGGITEFVTAETGELAAQNDVETLASYMENCRLSHIGFDAEVAHKRAGKYDLSNYLPKLTGILNSL
jgi:glycosyltransferase involved in cell wall biosynthesis